MYNTGKILTGLLIFLVLITFPIWYNLANGKAGYRPELEKAVKGTQCVRETDYMISHHMDLLNEWRDQVVREDERFEAGVGGVVYERSLTNTCLDCHADKSKFCDQCHTYLGVSPYCWSCHVDPKELEG
jgi:hypothetical protein